MRGVILALGALPVLAFAAESYPTCHVPPEAGHSCSDMGMKSCGSVCIEKDEVCCPDMSGGCPSSAYCLANKEGSYDCCDNGETCGSSSYPALPSSVSSAIQSSSSKAPVGYPVPTSVAASATYPGSGAVTSEAPVYTTSTICSTNIYTVTKCAEKANGGYCASSSTSVVTDIIPISTTVCTVTPTVTPTTYGFTTSTIYATTVHTVTSCAPNAGYCPAKSTVKVTDTYAISTTVCAITTKDSNYPGATHVPAPGSGPVYPPKAEYPGSEKPGSQYPGGGSGQPGSEYPGSGSQHPGSEYPGQGSNGQPAPYAPGAGAPTKAYPAPGSEQTGAYAPAPGKEYPGQPGAPGAPGAPYPGVAQPTTYHPTGGVKPIETGYPVTAGAASLEAVSKVLVAVVVGAVAML